MSQCRRSGQRSCCPCRFPIRSMAPACAGARDPRGGTLAHQLEVLQGLAIPKTVTRNLDFSLCSTFGITIDRQGDKLGLDLVHTGAGLRVVHIMPGMIDQHNQRAPDHERVLVYDVIRAVNGTSKTKEMMAKFLHDEVLRIEVARPDVVLVDIKKLGKPWGFVVALREVSNCIEVMDVAPGAVEEHNMFVDDTRLQVKACDLICSVNGVCGTPEKLVAEVERSNSIRLSIMRLGQ